MKLILLSTLAVLSIHGSGLLTWNLTGGTVTCREFNPGLTPLACSGDPTSYPFGHGSSWEEPSIQDGANLIVLRIEDDPIRIFYTPTAISGSFNRPANITSYLSFGFTFLQPPPADYNFTDIPVTAYLLFGSQTIEAEFTGLTGTLSSHVTPPPLQSTPLGAPEPGLAPLLAAGLCALMIGKRANARS